MSLPTADEARELVDRNRKTEADLFIAKAHQKIREAIGSGHTICSIKVPPLILSRTPWAVEDLYNELIKAGYEVSTFRYPSRTGVHPSKADTLSVRW